jgi:hypothetical protein
MRLWLRGLWYLKKKSVWNGNFSTIFRFLTYFSTSSCCCMPEVIKTSKHPSFHFLQSCHRIHQNTEDDFHTIGLLKWVQAMNASYKIIPNRSFLRLNRPIWWWACICRSNLIVFGPQQLKVSPCTCTHHGQVKSSYSSPITHFALFKEQQHSH